MDLGYSGQPHPHWQNLLAWLNTHGMDTSPEAMPVQALASPSAGYGLFARRCIDPAAPLFSTPPSALLNVATLSPFYPEARQSLTAMQLLSLHLFLYRPLGSRESTDPTFGPYISTLPREFDSHPLTWLCSGREDNPGSAFLSSLPPSVLYSLRKLVDRFNTDWRTVQRYIQDHDFAHPISEVIGAVEKSLRSYLPACREDFLWAWLNVNTRCLYYRLERSQSDKNNVTLCPILDFANHTTSSHHMSPQAANADRAAAPPRTDPREFTVLSPSDTTTKPGDEVYLTYGAHSNKTLFVEYGFVNEISNEILLRGDVHGESDVDDSIGCLFKARGKLGTWLQEVLTREGYWGDWTLHLQPLPAHPSYRLITALRLYHLFPASAEEVPLDADRALLPWKATLLGRADRISQENEEAWKDTLLQICSKLAEDATTAIASLDAVSANREIAWFSWMKKNIRMLWEEELFVTRMVAQSILGGEEF
ncbi:putative SET domain-containing protein [Lyophyllum shimeji]|uniref:SET domain-containing protein n=1 Tax=Lyophyllum shimeji TaxID=47721 RepID=A0A9P3UIW1_LYOSH|nr:putative SET domain-containing protein [Lyophyllum shimeji]